MDKNPQDTNPVDKHTSEKMTQWESEYSYIDYAMDHKFFKRFWWTLTAAIVVAAPLLAIFAYLSGSTYMEAQKVVNQTQAAYDRFEEAYDYFRSEDSLQAIRNENSRYYYYSIRFNEEKIIVHAMNSLFEEQGFGSRSVDVDSALNRYLYIEYGEFKSPARQWVVEHAKDSTNMVLIGVVHNGMPQSMLSRIDTLFKIVYTDPDIEYIQETRLPLGGFIYCVGY